MLGFTCNLYRPSNGRPSAQKTAQQYRHDVPSSRTNDFQKHAARQHVPGSMNNDFQKQLQEL